MTIEETMQKVENRVVWGGYGSLKVIGNRNIRQSVNKFLLAFHSRLTMSVPFLRYSEIGLLVESRRL